MRARYAVCVLPALLGCGSAHAETDFSGCAAGTPDARISACSALIETGSIATFESAKIFSNRGVAYIYKGQLDLAILDFNMAISLDPTLAAAYSNRGMIYQSKGDLGRAIEDFTTAIDLEPRFRMAFNNRCYALAQLGRAEQAIPDCDKALELQPADPRVLDSRGYAYFRAGHYADAIRDYDEALSLNSAMPEALYVRGSAKLKMGDPSGRTDLDQAIQFDQSVSQRMAKLGVGPDAIATIPTSAR